MLSHVLPAGRYDPLTAAAMSLGGAAIGAAFSPINPFQVGIAQKLAQLPLLSGWSFRTSLLVGALGIWIWGSVPTPGTPGSRPTRRPWPTPRR